MLQSTQVKAVQFVTELETKNKTYSPPFKGGVPRSGGVVLKNREAILWKIAKRTDLKWSALRASKDASRFLNTTPALARHRVYTAAAVLRFIHTFGEGRGVCILLLFALIFSVVLSAHAAEVSVAAASDLNFAIKEIIAGFERSTGNKVKLSLGSSGNFYAQISNGAPFEVFLSADQTYPQKLEADGKAEKGTTYTYAIGRIVLWLPSASRLDVNKSGLRVLADPLIKKISIANPDHAPYGKAAVAAMQHAGIYDTVKSKLVLGENISQAAQFVESGTADAGIIALSLALSDSMRKAGRYWEIPEDTYPRLTQTAVLMKGAGPAAHAFVDWLRRPESRQIFKRYGFGEP
jgi:molybdate transport system substrate-binding protein